jgi:putative transcriptional regulator
MNTNIKKLREKKGLTQQKVAETLGITRQTFSKMEKGEVEPSLGQAAKLGEML